MGNKFKLLCVLLCLVYIFAFSPTDNIFTSATESFLEEDEMKGVWVASVFNLDYPKSPTTDHRELKKGIDEIVKNVKDLGFNTIFFQVRPSSDALYKSDLFPWSKYLTGKEALSPDNNFDPLKYIISEAHKNDLSVHAWVNPYRVATSSSEEISPSSPASLHPEWVINYNDQLYLNPGIDEVNDFITDGIKEIAKNYDVDGIQIDDYFYPGEDFPDDMTFSSNDKGFTDKGDWRRNNITTLIKKIHTAVKNINPDIQFGVSPQGIWANADNIEGGSHTTGSEAYFKSYADTKLWVKENMIDYIIPQIYWNIGYAGADFKTLTDWWNDVVDGTNVRLYIGQAAYKAADIEDTTSVWAGESGVSEIVKQINLVRAKENVDGYSLYRLTSILSSENFKKAAKEYNSGKKDIFYDLSGFDWARDDILFLYKNGVINGMSDGEFSPAGKITRGQFAVMLSRIFGENISFEENFEDVKKDKYYYNDIGILKKLGYIQGISETEFSPETNIKRQDMAVLTYRILNKENLLSNTKLQKNEFSDSVDISPYAYDAVYCLYSADLLSGYEDNNFNPSGYATRAECAVFLSRVYNLLKK